MSPMGFAVHRQARHIASVMDEHSMYGEDWDYYGEDAPPMSYIKPVPIWLCVFLVIGYILGGAFLFQKWEQWDFLDAAYFCFITLTTIGEFYTILDFFVIYFLSSQKKSYKTMETMKLYHSYDALRLQIEKVYHFIEISFLNLIFHSPPSSFFFLLCI